jgi:hypothetical protein
VAKWRQESTAVAPEELSWWRAAWATLGAHCHPLDQPYVVVDEAENKPDVLLSSDEKN